jgi:NAD(P)H dehydrogenase (quinone)
VFWCELMIWQFPLWWFGLPSILKGWVDRVFAMGRIYGGGRVYDTGMLRGRRAMLSLTTGGPQESFVDGGMHGDIHAILRPIQRGIFQFIGMDVLRPQIVYRPARLSDDERRQRLEAYARRLEGIAGEAPYEVGRY